MKKNSFAIIVVILVVVLLTVVVVLAKNSTRIKTPTRSAGLEAFNTCLADKGAKFYGASWCPHCANQKKMLGYSKIETPPAYVECSPMAGSDLLPVCKDAGIQSFPTWIFADGSKLTGETSLETLSEKTSCQLPGKVGTSTTSTTVSVATSTTSTTTKK